jgi:hypothetical protein
MFDEKSRYASAEIQAATDSRGRTVNVVIPPPAPEQTLLGVHLLRQGERSDHLAAKYLDNAAGYWRLAEQNGAMLPDALTEQREIEIPVKSK